MMRYKVWVRDPDGQPGTLLLRTGSTEDGDCDIGEFFGTARDVAIEACSGGFVGVVLVKDFDTGCKWTVSSDGWIVEDGWS